MWYDRFEVYRLLGPTRTIDAAYRISSGLDSRAGLAWWKRAKQFNWKQRAEAWDKVGWRNQAAAEEHRRTEARQRRLLLLAQARESVWHALRRADLAEMDTEEARRQLSLVAPLLRRHFAPRTPRAGRRQRRRRGRGTAAARRGDPRRAGERLCARLGGQCVVRIAYSVGSAQCEIRTTQYEIRND